MVGVSGRTPGIGTLEQNESIAWSNLRRPAARGVANSIHIDNGPESITKEIETTMKQVGISTLCIEPGFPSDDSDSVSFNSKWRDEYSDMKQSESVGDTQELTVNLRRSYNEVRAHNASQYPTPPELTAGQAFRSSSTDGAHHINWKLEWSFINAYNS